jgi:hypothetical protein
MTQRGVAATKTIRAKNAKTPRPPRRVKSNLLSWRPWRLGVLGADSESAERKTPSHFEKKLTDSKQICAAVFQSVLPSFRFFSKYQALTSESSEFAPRMPRRQERQKDRK